MPALATWAAVLWQSVGNTMFGYGVWAWLLSRYPAATVVAHVAAGAGVRHGRVGPVPGRAAGKLEDLGGACWSEAGWRSTCSGAAASRS